MLYPFAFPVAQVSGGRAGSPQWGAGDGDGPGRVLEEFVETKVVKLAVESVDTATLSEDGARALRCLAHALQQRADGKPDDPRDLRLKEEDWD